MLETVLTIILIPIALGSVVFTAALFAGICKYFADKKKN